MKYLKLTIIINMLKSEIFVLYSNKFDINQILFILFIIETINLNKLTRIFYFIKIHNKLNYYFFSKKIKIYFFLFRYLKKTYSTF